MEIPNRAPSGKNGEKSSRSPLVFRYRRQPPPRSSRVSPFTELPEELKDSRFSAGGIFRRVVNGLLLLILELALVAMIAAFAYQMIYNPQAMAELCYNLIWSVEEFLASVTVVP